MKPESLDLAIAKTKELLEKLGVQFEDVQSEYDEANQVLKLTINGENVGMLIGLHGKNLDSLKVILSLMINKELGHENSVRIWVDINNYSEKRRDQLKSMILNAQKTMTTYSKDSYAFPPMGASDRMTVHTLAAELGLKTQSEGEGRNRHVVLTLK